MGLCEAVQGLRPNDPEIGFTLGDLYLSHVKTHLFRPHLAVPAYYTALRFGDATTRALAGKVACFRQLSRLDEAQKLLSATIRDHGDADRDLNFDQAQLASRQGHYSA